jgi:hypothetical protein
MPKLETIRFSNPKAFSGLTGVIDYENAVILASPVLPETWMPRATPSGWTPSPSSSSTNSPRVKAS